MPAFGFQQLPDERDDKYPLSHILGRAKPKVRSRFHRPGVVQQQYDKPYCVGYSCSQLLISEPVPQKYVEGAVIYREAKKIDEFPKGSEGTSLRAGLTVLKNRGLIDAYFWAKNTDQICDFLLRYGPVIVGTDWQENMSRPTGSGIVRLGGRSYGGHAYIILGCNLHTGMLWGINSWGSEWGAFGQFGIKIQDFQKLMAKGGVAAAVVEPGTKL